MNLENLLIVLFSNKQLSQKEFIIIIDGPVDTKIIDYIKYLKKNIKNIDIKIINFLTNKGLGLALKHGVKKAKYDLILRCDSDDFSTKNRVKLLYNSILKIKIYL